MARPRPHAGYPTTWVTKDKYKIHVKIHQKYVTSNHTLMLPLPSPRPPRKAQNPVSIDPTVKSNPLKSQLCDGPNNLMNSTDAARPEYTNTTNKNNHLNRKSKQISKKDPNHYQQWSLGTINVLSGKQKEGKINSIVYEIERANLLVCAIQELRFPGQGNMNISGLKSDFDLYWSGHARKKTDGVGVLIKNNNKIISDVAVTFSSKLPARIMAVELKIAGFEVKIINVSLLLEMEH